MIAFLLNDQTLAVDEPAGLRALDFLREKRRLVGTKEACGEGDCGSCAVLLGEWLAGTVVYRPVAACLLPLGELAGKHLVTIEGLNGVGVNPVQRALVDAGAVQCGYCMPGIVLSLTAFLLSGQPLQPAAAREALAGNLCRCTGYGGIKRTADALCATLAPRLQADSDPVAWCVQQGILPAYFLDIPGRLEQLPPTEPAVQGELAVHLGGGTDWLVQHDSPTAGLPLDFLSRHRELRGVWVQENRCFVGAETTVEDLRAAEAIQRYFPGLAQDLRMVCSPPIRERATLGGNLVNASPIGDLAVLLLALGAGVCLKEGHQVREIPLNAFFRGYKALDKTAGELLLWASFELPVREGGLSFEKVGKRHYLDIAGVNSALYIELAGETIERIGLSAGGVAPVPLFLHDAVDFLVGKPLTAAYVRQAAALAQAEVSPIDDMRGSAAYKRLLLRQLIYAHFLKLFPQRLTWDELQ